MTTVYFTRLGYIYEKSFSKRILRFSPFVVPGLGSSTRVGAGGIVDSGSVLLDSTQT